MIDAITDLQQQSELVAMARKLIASPTQLSVDWLGRHGWSAVPVPDALNAMDAEWLAEAAKERGITKVAAISIEQDETLQHATGCP